LVYFAEELTLAERRAVAILLAFDPQTSALATGWPHVSTVLKSRLRDSYCDTQ
jgi:hypothetical protein